MTQGMDQETFKTIVSAATPLTTAIVNTWVAPKLQQLLRSKKRQDSLVEQTLATKFGEYLQRAYEKHCYFNSIVFNNQRRQLDDFYIPLTVTARMKGRPANGSIVIDSYPDTLIPRYKRILLTDSAGMGKSTVLKYLFLSCLRTNKGVPVLIELRQLSSKVTILDLIQKELDAINEGFDRDFILDLIRRGDFVFFLDGFDEIPVEDRAQVVTGLQDFVSKAGNSLIILSSRPDESLVSFAEFQEFGINPLRPKEAFTLIRKFDPEGKVASALIQKLEGPTLANVKEFLANPLLVSLLFKSFEHKPTVPLRKPVFYRQVYDALYESHDLSKPGALTRQKACKLDLEEFHRVLRALGFITVKAGKVEYTKDELLGHLRQARAKCVGLNFHESDLLRDLRTTVPLFVEDGIYFKWAHKSIQEYFCAMYVCADTKGSQSEVLRKMANSPQFRRYDHVLDLCYDIDYKTFKHSVIKDLIEKFLNYWDEVYQGFGLTINEVALRKQLHFGKTIVLCSSDTLERLSPNGFKALDGAIRARGLVIPPFTTQSNGIVWADGGAVLSYASPPEMIVNLLRNKGSEMGEIVGMTPAQDKARPDQFMGTLDIVSVDYNPKSVFNQSNNFAKTTGLLFLGNDRFVLNIEACRKVLQEIHFELQDAAGEDLSF
jgi:hypothetical protein